MVKEGKESESEIETNVYVPGSSSNHGVYCQPTLGLMNFILTCIDCLTIDNIE